MATIARQLKRSSPVWLVLMWAVATLVLTTAFVVVGPRPSSGAVPFVLITDGPSPTPTECSDFAVSYGGGATWTQATFDTPTTGGTENGLTVTITFTGTGPGGEPIFDWTSSEPVDAVFAKAGNLGYLYVAEVSADTGLISPRDSVSHIAFCFRP